MRGPIGTVKPKAPADRSGDRRKPIAVALIAVGVIAADALDPADDDLVTLFHAGETNSSIERQIFLGRIGDLQQVALEPSCGKMRYGGIDRLERRQKVADQHELACPRQRLEVRQASCPGIAADHLDYP